MGRGMLVEIDGPNCAGKTTLSREVVRSLKLKGRPAQWLKEPGSTALGSQIRDILSEDVDRNIPEVARHFLYSAALADLIRKDVAWGIDAGMVTVKDRGWLSALAYQSVWAAGGVVHYDLVMRNLMEAYGHMRPDLTIYLSVPPSVALERFRARDDAKSHLGYSRSEGELLSVVDSYGEVLYCLRRKHVWSGCVPQFEMFTRHLVVLDAQLPLEELSERVVDLIEERAADII